MDPSHHVGVTMEETLRRDGGRGNSYPRSQDVCVPLLKTFVVLTQIFVEVPRSQKDMTLTDASDRERVDIQGSPVSESKSKLVSLRVIGKQVTFLLIYLSYIVTRPMKGFHPVAKMGEI